MTKRIPALLAALLMMLSFACCAEEALPLCEFELDAYGESGGMLYFTYAGGTTEETGGWGFSVEPEDGETTIGALLARYDVTNVEAACEGDIFEGWLTFEIAIETDEFGFDEYVYTLTDAAPISTEALLALPLPEKYTAYAAKWAGIPAENYYQPVEYEVETIRMAAATLFSGEGIMTFHGEEENYESSMSVATTEPGQTVGEVLDMDNLLSVTREGHEFTGWTVYEVADMETVEGEIDAGDLPCYEVFDGWHTVLWDYTLYGEGMNTEDVAALVCSELDYFIVADWA